MRSPGTIQRQGGLCVGDETKQPRIRNVLVWNRAGREMSCQNFVIDVVTRDYIVIAIQGSCMRVCVMTLSIGNMVSNKLRVRDLENIGMTTMWRNPVRQMLSRKTANTGCLLE